MRRAGGTEYDLETVWQFDAPVEAVWEAIVDAEGWPRWWRGVESVVTLARGDASGVGEERCYVFRSVLPFRLSFVTRVTRVEPMRLLEGRVEGELEGAGRCRFDRAGDATLVRYEWRVRTTRAWMNLLGPFAKPLFRWNHDRMMRAGGVGLARYLEGRSR